MRYANLGVSIFRVGKGNLASSGANLMMHGLTTDTLGESGYQSLRAHEPLQISFPRASSTEQVRPGE